MSTESKKTDIDALWAEMNSMDDVARHRATRTSTIMKGTGIGLAAPKDKKGGKKKKKDKGADKGPMVIGTGGAARGGGASGKSKKGSKASSTKPPRVVQGAVSSTGKVDTGRKAVAAVGERTSASTAFTGKLDLGSMRPGSTPLSSGDARDSDDDDDAAAAGADAAGAGAADAATEDASMPSTSAVMSSLGASFTAAEFLAAVRRDVNSISDENGAVRRRALERLQDMIFGGPPPDNMPPGVVAVHMAPAEGGAGTGGGAAGAAAAVADAAKAGARERPGLPDDNLRAIFPDVMKPLLKRFDDPVERCRELAANMTARFLAAVTDLPTALPYVIPAVIDRLVQPELGYDHDMKIFVRSMEAHMAHRRGVVTKEPDNPYTQRVIEVSEEVRLQLCNLLITVVANAEAADNMAVLHPYLHDIFLGAQAASVDPFPDLRVRGCEFLVLLARAIPEGTKLYAVGFVRSIMHGGLDHRHARVRIATLDAIHAMVTCEDKAKCKGAGTEAIFDLAGHHDENVVPVAAFYRHETTINYFAKLVMDRNPAVRERFARILGDWSHNLPDRIDYQYRLLPYMLNCLSDDNPAVSGAALEYMEALGVQYEKEHHDEIIEKLQYGVDGDSRVDHERPYPPPFGTRPRLGTRLYVRGKTRQFIKPLLRELGAWQHEARRKAAKMLVLCAVYMEEHFTVEVHALVTTLYSIIDDPEIGTDGLTATQLAGRFVEPDSYMPLLLPFVAGEETVATFGNVSARASALRVAAVMMQESRPSSVLPHVPAVVLALSDPYLLETKDERLRERHLDLITAVCSLLRGRVGAAVGAGFSKTGRLHDVRRDVVALVRVLLLHRGFNANTPERVARADEALAWLAKSCELPSARHLIAESLGDLMTPAMGSYPATAAWRPTCNEHVLILQLLQCASPEAVAARAEMLVDLATTLMSDDFEGQAAAARVAAADILTRIADDEAHVGAAALRAHGDAIMRTVVAADGWDASPEARAAWLDLVGVVTMPRTAPPAPASATGASAGAGGAGAGDAAPAPAPRAAAEFRIVSDRDVAAALPTLVPVLGAWAAELEGLPVNRQRAVVAARRLLEAGGRKCRASLPALHALFVARLDDSADAVRQAAAEALSAVLHASSFAPPARGSKSAAGAGAAEGGAASAEGGEGEAGEVGEVEEVSFHQLLSDALRAQHREGNSAEFLDLLTSFLFEATVVDPAAVSAMVREGTWDVPEADGGAGGFRADGKLSEHCNELLEHAEFLASLQAR